MTGRLATVFVLAALVQTRAAAHSGPPFPIVTDRSVGQYVVSLWTDPDATDDGSAQGQFWVVFHAGAAKLPPPDARVEVAVRPSDREGSWRRANAAPVNGDLTRRFAAVPMDHEGPYVVTVTLDGPRGELSFESPVDATYDLRPSPYLIAVYLLPFLLIGGLWVKLILARRRS